MRDDGFVLRRFDPVRAENVSHGKDEVTAAALLAGLTTEEAERYYNKYDSVGWIDAVHRPIRNVQSHMAHLKGINALPAPIERDQKKVRLFPLPGGKVCKCGAPAVYKSSGGAYDNWYCIEHIPDKVKVKLREQNYDV